MKNNDHIILETLDGKKLDIDCSGYIILGLDKSKYCFVNMKNNYHIILETLDGEKLDIDCIAYDRSVTYPNCLTIFIQSNYKVVVDLDNIKCISITSIK